MTSILETLRGDYQRFPQDPSYHLYAETVFFKDPMTQFQGLDRYKNMVSFMGTWFKQMQLELHGMEQQDQVIHSRWTLSWTGPLPWKPHIVISGRTEMTLNEAGLIASHIDYWDCSRLDMIRQHFVPGPRE
jgi:hypothetical protein